MPVKHCASKLLEVAKQITRLVFQTTKLLRRLKFADLKSDGAKNFQKTAKKNKSSKNYHINPLYIFFESICKSASPPGLPRSLLNEKWCHDETKDISRT